MSLLPAIVGLSIAVPALIWSARRRVAVMQRHIDDQHRDLGLALRGTGEALWLWHLDTQEISHAGFEPLTDGALPKRINAIAFIREFIHPEDAVDFQQAIDEHLRGDTAGFEVSYRLRHLRHDWIWIHSRGRIVERDPQQRPLRIAGASKDISHTRGSESESRIALEVMRNMDDAVAVTDLHFHFVTINPAFSRITGYKREETIGRSRQILHSNRHDDAFYRELRNRLETTGRWSGELWQKRKDGGEFLSKVDVSEVLDTRGQRSHFVAVLSDITDRKRIEQELVQLAKYDALTGLPSRNLFVENLSKCIIKSRRSRNRIAVLHLDLDHFKDLNDSLGHIAGDRLLVAISQRLQAATRELGMIARLSSDEFAILLESAGSNEQIADAAMHVLNQFNQPLVFGGAQTSSVSTSIGISIFPDHAQTPSDLLMFADIAVCQAKAEGRNTIQCFSKEMDAKSRARGQILNALKSALIRDEFQLHFQPRMSLETGSITSVEALLRWQCGENGSIGPDVFIPLAEESGQIIDIGKWALEEAIYTLSRWHRTGLNHLSMSINVSVLQLLRSKLAEQISELVEKYAIPEYCIELEITESIVLCQNSQSLSNLWALKELGVTLSLDDFGTGYASLSYLKQLPIDILKIDKSFIREIGPSSDDNTLAETMIALGHSLGKVMIAEGVENEEHLQMLKKFGCDEIQGYWLSHPMPAEQCLDFIQNHEHKRWQLSSPAA